MVTRMANGAHAPYFYLPLYIYICLYVIYINIAKVEEEENTHTQFLIQLIC
jgi:hypothetical protein